MTMDFNELKKKIDEINIDVQNINSTRLQNLGKRETLEGQLNGLLSDYNKKYNAQLSLDTIDDELSKLIQAKEEEFNKLQQGINLIKEGKYAEADELLNGKKAEPTTNGDVVKEVVENKKPEVVAEAPAVETPVAPPTTEAVVEKPAEVVAPPITEPTNVGIAPATEEVVAPPAPPITEAPKTEDIPAPPAPPIVEAPKAEEVAPPAPPITETAKAEETPVAPPNTIPGQTPLTPPTSNPSSFGAIFGGTSFSL